MVRETVVLDQQKIRRYRLKRALTYKKIASVSGLTLPTVANAVHGRRVTLRTATEIARALELPVEDLVILQDRAEPERCSVGAA